MHQTTTAPANAGPPEYRPVRTHGANDDPNLDPYKLEHIFFSSHVLYRCSCQAYKRLYNMYFCRHCMAMRCRDCVSHEMDTQYCQHCLEYIPTIDPKFQKNKCATCYDCPSCHHLLSVTTLSVTQPSAETASEPTRKSCLLTCAFCRWSSQEFNVFESSKVTNDLPDIQLAQSTRIDKIFDHYHALASREKSEREKRRLHPRSGNALHLLDKYGISASLSPKLTASLRAKSYQSPKMTSPSSKSFANQSSPSMIADKATEKAIADFSGPVANDESVQGYEELDSEFYYNRDFDLDAVSSIQQRLAQIELQPTRVADFNPISKTLSVKRSLRCKVCEHNLCKSEFNPASIKFKIQLSAYYHIPEIRVRPRLHPAQLKLNELNLIELNVQNQTPYTLNVKFEPTGDVDDNGDRYELVLPPESIQVNQKDETADVEHAPIGGTPLDDAAQVMFRRGHKTGVFIRVKPLNVTHELVVTFNMCHDIVVLQGPREPDKIESMTHRLRVSLGEVVQ